MNKATTDLSGTWGKNQQVVFGVYLHAGPNNGVVSTVVSALGNPVVSGNLVCAATLSMSRHISTLNYLRSADTCLMRTVIYWLLAPAITNSANATFSIVVSTKNHWCTP